MNPSQEQHAASWWAYSSSQAAAHGGGVGNLAPDHHAGAGYLPTHHHSTLHGHSTVTPSHFAPQPNYILQPQVPLPFQQASEHFRLPSGGGIHPGGFLAPPPPHASGSSVQDMVQGMPHTFSPALTQDSSIVELSSSAAPVKKKRPQSCDACRTRKIKCVRLSPHLPAGVPESVLAAAGPGITMGPESVDARCSPCKAIGAECTYKYIPKRPGPQTSLVKGIKRDPTERKRSNSSSNATSGKVGLTKSREGKRNSPDRPKSQPSAAVKEAKAPSAKSHSMKATASGSSSSSVGTSPTLQFGGVQSSPVQSLVPLRSPQIGLESASMFGQWGYVGMPATSDSSTASWPNTDENNNRVASLSGNTDYFTQDLSQSLQMGALNGAAGMPLHSLPSTTFADAVSPASSASAAPTASNGVNLEDVAPRQLFHSIIALYLRHLYVVYPIVHRPTLAIDLLAGRDSRDADFLALIFSLTAATLALLPPKCYPSSLSEQSGANLQMACHVASKRSQSRTYSPARLIHVVTLLLDNIYLGRTGASGAASAAFGEATRVAFMLGLHDERRWHPSETTDSANAVERELRARVFYVLYGVDKSIALLTEDPLGLHDDDVWVTLPPHAVEGDAEADLRAFRASVQLSLLLSELLRTARSRHSAGLLNVDERIQHVENVHQRAGRVVDELNSQSNAVADSSTLPFMQQQHQPGDLATPSLESGSHDSSSRHTSRRSSHSTLSRVAVESPGSPLHQLLRSGDSSVASLGAEQANVLVSAAVVRFVATECSITLRHLRSGGDVDKRGAAQSLEMAAQETLEALQSLGDTDALVVNGQILTGKLLYVATALTNRPGRGSSRTLDSLLDYLSRLGDNTRHAGPSEVQSR